MRPPVPAGISEVNCRGSVIRLVNRLGDLSLGCNLVLRNEIQSAKEEALNNVAAIRTKFGPASERLLTAYEQIFDHILLYAYGCGGDEAFTVCLAMIREANIKVAEFIKNSSDPKKLISDLEEYYAYIADQDGKDITEKVFKETGINIVLSKKNMTLGERQIISWIIGGLFPRLTDGLPCERMTAARIAENALGRYPREMLAQFPSRIVFYMDQDRSNYGGAAGGKSIFVTPREETLHHELFHWKDTGSFLWFGDNAKWNRITGRITPNDYSSIYRNNSSYVSMPGFARPYGCTNANEDQATVAEMLFMTGALDLKWRLACDYKLQVKVELITGCHYDVERGVFTKVYSADELKQRYGISGHLYYAKRSNIGGRVLMDANYWNGVLEANRQMPPLPSPQSNE